MHTHESSYIVHSYHVMYQSVAKCSLEDELSETVAVTIRVASYLYDSYIRKATELKE